MRGAAGGSTGTAVSHVGGFDLLGHMAILPLDRGGLKATERVEVETAITVKRPW